MNAAKDDAVEAAAVKIDNAKQESAAQADLLKAGANTAIDQGLKQAENVVDDQLRAAEKVIDEKMQAASKAVDDKINEANKYADAKRQELTNVIILDNFLYFLVNQSNYHISDHHRKHRQNPRGCYGRGFELVGQVELGRRQISSQKLNSIFHIIQCLYATMYEITIIF